jgi:putative heme-binding domain-containing protein
MQIAVRYTHQAAGGFSSIPGCIDCGEMRHRDGLISALPLLLVLAPFLCRAQSGANPFARNAQAVEEGRKSFAVSCAPCHGRNGEGAQGQSEGIRPPDLTRGSFKAGPRDEDLFRVIAKGVEGSGMPSFEPLGTDQIWRLVAFVRTLSRPEGSAAGNAAAGETLFWVKGDCGRCHAVGSRGANRGANLGPDLSRGGRRSTAQRLKRSILAPDDEIAPGYEVVVIVTRDGKTVSGLARFFDDFSARIIDSSGKERTYLRDEVVSMRREMRSLMPGDYGKIFSGPELDDLVAYILTLQSETGRQ